MNVNQILMTTLAIVVIVAAFSFGQKTGRGLAR